MEGELDPDVLQMLQDEAMANPTSAAEHLSAEDVEMLLTLEAGEHGFGEPS